MVYLAQGNLPDAQKIIRQAAAEVDPTAIVIYVAQYWDLYWALDDEQQQLALRLPWSRSTRTCSAARLCWPSSTT
jgi:hypothetical protein